MMPPPLPSSSLPSDAVRITTERSELPPDVAVLVDPAAPLPAGVVFFEKRVTLADVLSAAAWSVGMAVLGVLALLWFVDDAVASLRQATVYSHVSYWPLGFAFVCGIAAWLMASAVFTRLGLRAAQAAGRPTRAGLLLTPTTLIEVGDASWTVVPRPAVRGVAGAKVTYRMNEQDKSFTLPATFVGTDRPNVERAIAEWVRTPPRG